LIQRLQHRRQVHGVQGMLSEATAKSCGNGAIHSAVQSASRIFLQEYATACLVEMDEEMALPEVKNLREKRTKIVQDMIALLDKAP
jgi:DNA-binding FrmR family transcriptional regulator